MNVREAIAEAKTYIRDVYAEEEVSNLGLEETLYDDGLDQWRITLGFSRPWNTPRTSTQAVLDKIGAFDGAAASRKRVFKVVTIDHSGNVISMTNREVADTDG